MNGGIFVIVTFLAGDKKNIIYNNTLFNYFVCLLHTINKNNHCAVHPGSRFNAATTNNFSHRQTTLLHCSARTTRYDLKTMLPRKLCKLHSRRFANNQQNAGSYLLKNNQ
ncbi:hypothetical protein ATANTOWER_009408 [Ataeniobius toweri]|uniref:Uncharacterized protein n=1 Tax=Ataeniobius toweri TaxID=208326 RepID=A0ABU7CJL2_9TELE|nr:hypothetical protein [Ataeniobius toweri]